MFRVGILLQGKGAPGRPGAPNAPRRTPAQHFLQFPKGGRHRRIHELCLSNVFAQFSFPEEGPFVEPLPLWLLVSMSAVLFIVAVYFIWSRNFEKKLEKKSETPHS
jgi:hypothetical protein